MAAITVKHHVSAQSKRVFLMSSGRHAHHILSVTGYSAKTLDIAVRTATSGGWAGHHESLSGFVPCFERDERSGLFAFRRFGKA